MAPEVVSGEYIPPEDNEDNDDHPGVCRCVLCIRMRRAALGVCPPGPGVHRILVSLRVALTIQR